jgi:hypothetical protein
MTSAGQSAIRMVLCVTLTVQDVGSKSFMDSPEFEISTSRIDVDRKYASAAELGSNRPSRGHRIKDCISVS